MSNDPKSKWSKRTAELPTAKSGVKEMSLNERLKLVRAPGQARTDEDGIARNRFGDSINRETETQEFVVQPPAAKPTRVGKTVLDPETLAAREAYEASRQNTKNQQSRAARIAAVMEHLSQDDANSILRGFCAKVPTFWASPFNVSNLTELWKYCFANSVEGVDAFNIKALTICYEWGAAQTQPPFFEPKMRRRGEMAAQIFTCPVEEPEPERVALSASTVRVREVATPEDIAELKNLPFDQLQAEARKGFKSKRPDINDFKG